MASLFHFFPFLSSILIFLLISPSLSQPSFRPKALLLPITKDPSSLQYITQFSQRTPLIPIKLTLDLNGPLLWVHCENNSYISSSFTRPHCRSSQCARVISSTACGVNESCIVFPDNPIANTGSADELRQDIISLPSTDGFNPKQSVSIPNIIFSCGSTFLTQGLANGVQGMAGLGRSKVSLPIQFSAAFSFPRKFALCLSSSKGVAFFGNGPYNLLPNIELSKSLSYTPLILNPIIGFGVSETNVPSPEYYIGVKSIKVNGKVVPLNKTLLSIDEKGRGGTRISTVDPYTVLETSIYKAVVKEFDDLLSVEVPRVKAVAPFGFCYDVRKIVGTRLGARVPLIEMELGGGKNWMIFGGNSMVEAKGNAICLGFVDGGRNPRTAIVIGGKQLEDNLVEFDLAAARFGFSGSLRSRQTLCSNFNFTATA